MLSPPRGIDVAGALRGNGLFQLRDARVHRVCVALGGGRLLLAALLDLQLCRVQLRLDLHITVRHRVGVRGNGIGLVGKNSAAENRDEADNQNNF